MNYSIPFILFFLLCVTTLSYAERGLKLIDPQKPVNNRTALVIGNAAYQSSPLINPVNDASAMATTLKNNGFDVIVKLDANRKQMQQSINEFGKRLRSGGTGFFYYAGHGIQVDGRNYLIPIGVNIESESDIKYEAVDAGRVLGKMDDAENALNIVVMDACRNNPFSRSFRSADKGLAKMDAPTGTIIAYATAPGSVAADGNDKNGLYTMHLLKYLNQPRLQIEEVFKKVRIAVVNDSQKKQVPWESSSLTGNFIFNIKGANIIINTAEKKIITPKKNHPPSVVFISNDWEPWNDGQGISQISKNSDNSIRWNYAIAEVNGKNDAGLALSVEPQSIKNKKIHLNLISKKGFPIDLSLYSFVPGYSKKDDYDSLVRVDFRINLNIGENDLIFESKYFKIPRWWLEEHNMPQVQFNFEDIRELEFNIELESGFGPPSDILNIYKIEIY